jgi:uncharacterized membrane protein YphA (DoxX/SURF4 family)
MRNLQNRLDRLDRAIAEWMGKYAITCLRVALGITYLWFGALKVFGVSPVEDLLAKTVYLLPKEVVVPMIGIWEIAIGIGLLFRLALRVTLLLFFFQLMGTFMVLIIHPQEAFQNGNPLMLTQTGEFIIKNLILLTAGIVVGSTVRRKSEKISEADGKLVESATEKLRYGS